MIANALVTGSSSGIGAAIARRLLADGWWVQGWDVAKASIEHEHFRAHTVDLCDEGAIDAALATLPKDGAPQALVHAAGVLRTAPLGALRDGDGECM